ncbi:MAG: hypothetical protein EA358_08500 [Flavobacteriales bacterium]|nr:MAG: hypothetical protein EA358_08500 [Flavobacteriales bacterium]
MMFLHKISRVLLGFLLVISAGGFSTFSHYCKGNLVSSSIILPVDPCSGGSCALKHQHSADDDRDALSQHCCEDVNLFLQITSFRIADWSQPFFFLSNPIKIELRSFAFFENPNLFSHVFHPPPDFRRYLRFANLRL